MNDANTHPEYKVGDYVKFIGTFPTRETATWAIHHFSLAVGSIVKLSQVTPQPRPGASQSVYFIAEDHPLDKDGRDCLMMLNSVHFVPATPEEIAGYEQRKQLGSPRYKVGDYARLVLGDGVTLELEALCDDGTLRDVPPTCIPVQNGMIVKVSHCDSKVIRFESPAANCTLAICVDQTTPATPEECKDYKIRHNLFEEGDLVRTKVEVAPLIHNADGSLTGRYLRVLEGTGYIIEGFEGNVRNSRYAKVAHPKQPGYLLIGVKYLEFANPEDVTYRPGDVVKVTAKNDSGRSWGDWGSAYFGEIVLVKEQSKPNEFVNIVLNSTGHAVCLNARHTLPATSKEIADFLAHQEATKKQMEERAGPDYKVGDYVKVIVTNEKARSWGVNGRAELGEVVRVRSIRTHCLLVEITLNDTGKGALIGVMDIAPATAEEFYQFNQKKLSPDAAHPLGRCFLVEINERVPTFSHESVAAKREFLVTETSDSRYRVRYGIYANLLFSRDVANVLANFSGDSSLSMVVETQHSYHAYDTPIPAAQVLVVSEDETEHFMIEHGKFKGKLIPKDYVRKLFLDPDIGTTSSAHKVQPIVPQPVLPETTQEPPLKKGQLINRGDCKYNPGDLVKFSPSQGGLYYEFEDGHILNRGDVLKVLRVQGRRPAMRLIFEGGYSVPQEHVVPFVEESLPQYEYKNVTNPDTNYSLIPILNEHGKEGWQAVSGDRSFYTMGRRVRPGASPQDVVRTSLPPSKPSPSEEKETVQQASRSTGNDSDAVGEVESDNKSPGEKEVLEYFEQKKETPQPVVSPASEYVEGSPAENVLAGALVSSFGLTLYGLICYACCPEFFCSTKVAALVFVGLVFFWHVVAMVPPMERKEKDDNIWIGMAGVELVGVLTWGYVEFFQQLPWITSSVVLTLCLMVLSFATDLYGVVKEGSDTHPSPKPAPAVGELPPADDSWSPFFKAYVVSLGVTAVLILSIVVGMSTGTAFWSWKVNQPVAKSLPFLDRVLRDKQPSR